MFRGKSSRKGVSHAGGLRNHTKKLISWLLVIRSERRELVKVREEIGSCPVRKDMRMMLRGENQRRNATVCELKVLKTRRVKLLMGCKPTQPRPVAPSSSGLRMRMILARPYS